MNFLSRVLAQKMENQIRGKVIAAILSVFLLFIFLPSIMRAKTLTLSSIVQFGVKKIDQRERKYSDIE